MITKRIIRCALTVGLIGYLAVSCSSGDEKEPEEAVEGENAEGSDGADGDAAAAPEDAAGANSTSEAGFGANSAMGNTTGGSMGAAGALMTPQAPEGRHVRYVLTDQTPVYDQANDAAQTVGMLNKGDIVVVMIQGGWASISEKHFVRAAALTEKGIGRKRLPLLPNLNGAEGKTTAENTEAPVVESVPVEVPVQAAPSVSHEPPAPTLPEDITTAIGEPGFAAPLM